MDHLDVLCILAAAVAKAGYSKEAIQMAQTCKAMRNYQPLWGCIKDVYPIQGSYSGLHGKEHIRTRLMYCAKQGDTGRLRWLLARGANPNLQGFAGGSALLWASVNGNTDCVRVLLGAGADAKAPKLDVHSICSYTGRVVSAINTTPLMDAVAGGHLDIVRLLIQHNATLNTQRGDEKTALMLAAMSRPERADIVKLLCEAGADVTLKDRHRSKATELAVEQDNLQTLEILYGFDKHALWNEWSMLSLAVENNAVAVVKSLLVRCPHLAIQGMYAQQVFESAASRGNMELFQILLDAQVDKQSLPNVLNNAAISGNPELIRMLCEMGYPKDSVQLAFNRALNCGNTDAALILQKYGAKLQRGYRL